MVLGEPDAVEAELLRPHHLLDLLTDDVRVRDGRRSLEEVIGAEAHRGGSTLHHLAVQIDQPRGVSARDARARSAGPRRQWPSSESVAAKNASFRPVTRFGTCMTPRVTGSGASIAATSISRAASSQREYRRIRVSGQRVARNTRFAVGFAGWAVVHW